MIKAMVEHLATTSTLTAPRKRRFSEKFNDDIMNMVASFTGEIIAKHHKADFRRKMNRLNACLAFFLHDLLSIMDRGFVFSLIRTYMKERAVNEPYDASKFYVYLFCLKASLGNVFYNRFLIVKAL